MVSWRTRTGVQPYMKNYTWTPVVCFSLCTEILYFPERGLYWGHVPVQRALNFLTSSLHRVTLAWALFTGFTKESQGCFVDAAYMTSAIPFRRKHLELLFCKKNTVWNWQKTEFISKLINFFFSFKITTYKTFRNLRALVRLGEVMP